MAEEMMNEKQRETLKQMQLVRYHYERLQTEFEAATSSRGLVAVWGRVGGSGNRIDRPTQNRALSDISAEEHLQAMLCWFESIRKTCERLKAKQGKSPNLWRHQVILAKALRLYVFERADLELLAMLLEGPRKLSRQRVIRILREAVDEVAADAE